MSAVFVEMIAQHMSLIRAMRQEIQNIPELQKDSLVWLRELLDRMGAKVARFIGEQGLQRFPERLVTAEVDHYLIDNLRLIQQSRVTCQEPLHAYISKLMSIRAEYPIAPDERSHTASPISPHPSPAETPASRATTQSRSVSSTH